LFIKQYFIKQYFIKQYSRPNKAKQKKQELEFIPILRMCSGSAFAMLQETISTARLLAIAWLHLPAIKLFSRLWQGEL